MDEERAIASVIAIATRATVRPIARVQVPVAPSIAAQRWTRTATAFSRVLSSPFWSSSLRSLFSLALFISEDQTTTINGKRSSKKPAWVERDQRFQRRSKPRTRIRLRTRCCLKANRCLPSKSKKARKWDLCGIWQEASRFPRQKSPNTRSKSSTKSRKRIQRNIRLSKKIFQRRSS